MASRLPYPKDHASHIPFLVGLGAYYPIRTVVEFGSGLYSTPLFLNLKAFPKLDCLISSEPDAKWRDKIYEVTGPDKRLDLLSKDPDLLVFAFIDLIFIDNGPEQHKIETIRWIAEQSAGPIVVVHDAETATYRSEIDKFQTKFVSEKFNPGTAICTNGNLGEAFATNFFSIEMMIKGNSHIPVDDVKSWIEVFNG